MERALRLFVPCLILITVSASRAQAPSLLATGRNGLTPTHLVPDALHPV